MARRPRPDVLLSAAAIAVFQVGASFGAAEGQADRKGIDLLAVLLLVAGPAALAVRDRYPRAAACGAVAATIVFVGLGYPFGPVFLSLVVGLFTLVQVGRRRAAWALAAAAYVGFWTALAWGSHAPDHTGLLHYSAVAGWLVVVLSVSEVVRTRRTQLAERAQRAEEARRRQADEERLGLAQELHDVLAHNISLINVQASVALHLVETQPERAGPALAAIKDASHDALQELRAALDVLRHGDDAAPRAPAPRLADLDELVSGVRGSGLDVRLEVPAPGPALPAAVELAAYRIVQEALTNVTRHARARAVQVRVDYDDGVVVEVVDDGVGGPAEPGNGLRGMQERARALGGHVEAGPRPGGGFGVRATLPRAAP